MGLFNKKDKYNINAEDNVPQKVYGVPDIMRKKWEEEVQTKQDKVKEKYDITPEDNVPQKVYGVPNVNFSSNKIKKESINVVIADCCLSLTKWGNKCDLLYVSNNKTSYAKDSTVSISITKFDEFCNRLKEVIADWNVEYFVDEGIVWNLKIDINGLNKQISGKGTYPKNWNLFIDLLSEYEILFKKVLSFDKEENRKKTDLSFEKVVESKVNDPFVSKLIIDYFKNEIGKNDAVYKVLFKNLSKYDDIFNEFTKYLVQRTYDIPNPINAGGYTAKQIAELNPKFKATGVYIFLKYLREKPEEAKEMIKKGFPNKDVIPSTMNDDYHI